MSSTGHRMFRCPTVREQLSKCEEVYKLKRRAIEAKSTIKCRKKRYTPTGLVPSVCFPMSPATLGVQPEDRHREIKAGTV